MRYTVQKYNSCLETLDISKNPCSGPELDGVSQAESSTTLTHVDK